MFDFGDPVPLSVEIRDAAGALANATSVSVSIVQPDGTSATISNPIAPASTGVYAYSFTPTQAGRHAVRWVASGTNASAYTDSFDVDESVPNGIVSLAEAKAHLNITVADDDDELRDMIDAASEWVEGRVGPVVRRTITEDVTPKSGLLFLQQPLVSLTSMTDTYGYGYTYDVAEFYPETNGIVSPLAYVTYPTYPVTVTYVAGRAVVPASIRTACLMYLKALWETQRGSTDLPIQGFSDDADAGDGMGLAVWRAERLLEPYLLPPSIA